MSSREIVDNINEAKVVMYPMDGVLATRIEIILRAGSYYEPTKDWGAMHLLEHMLFKNTSRFKSHLDMEYFKETWGIRSNGYTGPDAMGFWYLFPRDSYKQAIELISEQMFNPVFKQEDLEKEKAIINQEYTDKWSNPHTRHMRDIYENEYGKNHIFIRDGMGIPDCFNSISLKQIKSLHHEFFYPANMTIGIAGNFIPEKMKSELSSILPKGISKPPKTVNYKKTKVSSNTVWSYHDEDKMTVTFAWKKPGYSQLDLRQRLEYSLLLYVLGGSSRSMLFQKLREEHGLVYRTDATSHSHPTVGAVEVHISIHPSNLKKAEQETLKTVYSFSKKISKKTFYRAKKFVKTSFELSYDSVSNIATKITNQMFSYGEVESLDEVLSTLEVIKLEDIVNLSNKILNKKNFMYTAILSRKNPF